MNATLDRVTTTASTGISQPRRDPRPASTVTDVFDGGTLTRDRVGEGGKAESGPGALGLWAKPPETSGRSILTNGHSTTGLGLEPNDTTNTARTVNSPNPPPLASGLGKRDPGWSGMAFPSLSDYLNRSRPPQPGTTGQTRNSNSQFGNMFGTGQKMGSILSPPKTSTGILGGKSLKDEAFKSLHILMARSGFNGPTSSITPAGTQK